MGRLKMETGQGLCRPAKMTLLGVLTQSSDKRQQLTVPVVMDADNASPVTNFAMHWSISPSTSLTPNVLLALLHCAAASVPRSLRRGRASSQKKPELRQRDMHTTQGSLRPGDDNLVELGCRADIS